MRRIRVRWARAALVVLGGVALALAGQVGVEARARRAAETERDAARLEAERWREDAAILGLGTAPGQRWAVEDYELSSGSPPRVTLKLVPEPPGPAREPELELYPVSDLLSRPIPGEALLAVVRGLAADDPAWSEPALIELHRGQLIVKQTPALQARVRAILTRLRACVTLPLASR